MEEKWKDIYFIENGIEYDYKGLYQISNFGRIKSLERIDESGNKRKEKILKPTIQKRHQYNKNSVLVERVELSKNKIKKRFYIHRLVAHMFLSETYFDGAEINHKDENTLNNKIDNLEWCTTKYNVNYSQSVPIIAIKIDTNEKFEFDGINIAVESLNKKFNINLIAQNVIRICQYNDDKDAFIKKYHKARTKSQGFTFYYKK